MMILLHVKHHKRHFSHNDIVTNVNTEANLVNTIFIKEITPFNINETKGFAFDYFGYLEGSKSTIWYDDYNRTHCIETVEEIYAMLN